ncbi:hypothetical protein [Trinickia dinghuensis]|uniref:Uncharacterized protein n=1 Tax=Trinickia dinghuensis TaxID=2291023 RepID=A0A3D8JUI3_9BURK|nr:hypothetical protein [Trinickia dinghuensis]RDU96296.1 hypothetical protein DWV00_24670 [Trinickia dinghuensis]
MITDEQQCYGPKLDRLLQIREIDSLGALVPPIFPIAPLPTAETGGLAQADDPVSAYAALLAQVSPRLPEAVEEVCGPAPWIVRSAGIEDLADHINAGGYESLICLEPENLMQRVAAVALSGSTEHARRQWALSGRSERSASIACFVQPLLKIDVADDIGLDHSPYLDAEVLDRIEAVCAVLMKRFDFTAIDCEWGLETELGFVSITTVMPLDQRLMNVAHTIGFGFACAQNTGSRATTLALRPASTALRLWRGRHLRETPVRRLHLLQARPATPEVAFRDREALTDDCYEALARHYEVVEAALLILGDECFGQTLVAPDLASAWRRYLALDGSEQAAVAVVIVDEGSAEEHAGIMFRQQKITCIRTNTQRVPAGAHCAAFDRGSCILGGSAMLRSIKTEVRRELVLPDDCSLIFTDEALTRTGELTQECNDALSQLQRLPLAKEAKERLLARTEQPMPTLWMQRVDGAVGSPSLLAQIRRSQHSWRGEGLIARTEFAKAYERAVRMSQAESLRALPTLVALSSATRPLAESADLRLAMRLLDCEAAASWVPRNTLSRLLESAARQLAAQQADNAALVLESASLVGEECARLPLYEMDEVVSYLNALAHVFEGGLSPASRLSIHSLGLPIPSAVLLALRALDCPAVLAPIERFRHAVASSKGIASAGEAVERLSQQLNDAYARLCDALGKADLKNVAEQIRGSLIETYDASLKALLARAVEGGDAESYKRYLSMMRQWIALLSAGPLSNRDDIVLRRFQLWLRQWSDEETPTSFEIEDRNWRSEFDSIVSAGEAAPRYENPHVLHNLLHQWSLAGMSLDTRQLPERVRALERFCSTFSSRSTKVLRFERELLEIQIPMGTHKASYVFTPLHITVEWTEPPDCPGDEIARILAFEIFLDRLRSWMFPRLTARRERVLGTWTLFIRLGVPASRGWHIEDFTAFVAATRFLFDASYDFSYVENDSVSGFAERFGGADWESIVTTFVRYRAAMDDRAQYVALHALPMSSAVGAIAQSPVVRGLILRCLRGGVDYGLALIDGYAHWLESHQEVCGRWRDRYEYLRQASLFLAATWPREVLAWLTHQEGFHVGHDLISACLFKRSELSDELRRIMAAGDSMRSGMPALIARHAPEIAVKGWGPTTLAMQLAGTGARFRRAKHFLVAHFAASIDPIELGSLLQGMDTVPWGCTAAAERAIETQILTGRATCRFDLQRGIDWTALSVIPTGDASEDAQAGPAPIPM